MSFKELLFCTDINLGLRNYQADSGAVLLDVRVAGEYQRKHIEDALSLPVEEIDRAPEVIPDRNTPIYVYAYGGETSLRAVKKLRKLGYKNVNDIGGIKKCCGTQGYQGPWCVEPENG